MIRDINLLLVGGAGRNVGKTEFVCRVIRKISRQNDVYGLKVSTIFPDEQLYHGSHDNDLNDYMLFEETRLDTTKDTSRMLLAGAKRVFYLQSDEAGLANGFEKFKKAIPAGAIVVCESNSLGLVIEPGLHIVVKSVTGGVKKRAVRQLEEADLVVVSDGESGFPELSVISYSPKDGWILDNQTRHMDNSS